MLRLKGKADLDEFRTEIGVPERDTIAVEKTDVRGLEGYKFKVASPQVRADAKLDFLDNIYPNRLIKAPYNKTIRGQGQFVEHAEEYVIAQFEDAVIKTGLKPGEVEGTLYIHQSNPDGVCNKCTVDLFKSSKNGKNGILKQLTEKYPDLTIKVSTEIDPAIEFPANTLSFELKNGEVIDAIQIRKNPTNPFQFKEYPK